MEDIIVTLLNGTKVPKSKVPVGEIYINEKGQKCRKVVKVVATQKVPEPKCKGVLGDFTQKVTSGLINGSNQLIKVSKNTFSKIGEKRRKAKASANAFMDSMFTKLIEKMQLDKTIKSLENYQKESGKDVHDLIEFLTKIQQTTKN